MNGSKHITALLAALLLMTGVQAQVSVRATTDRDSILIGEPINLTIEAYLPLGLAIGWPVPDTIPHFDILQRHKIDSAQNIDGKKISQVLTITAFDSGHYVIPPLEVRIDTLSYFTDTLRVAVGYSPFNPADDYRDIRDIIEVKDPSMKWVPWILAAAAVISAALIAWLIRRRKKPLVPAAAPAPLLTPFEEAMKALRTLEKQRMEAGAEKKFYSSLNDVLRTYLSRTFNISTFERTNGELIGQLSNMGLESREFDRLAQALRMIDMVKFARYVPGENESGFNLEVIRSSIKKLENKVTGAVQLV